MSPYLRIFYSDHVQDVEVKDNFILGGQEFPIQGCDTTFHFYQTPNGYMVSSVNGTTEVTDGAFVPLGDGVKALFVLPDSDEVASIAVNDIAEFAIGRGTECDMVLPSRREVRSDVTYVSRSHVKVLHKAKGWRILPAKQDARVYINSKAISGIGDVFPGDTIEIGKYTITVSENRFAAYAKIQSEASTGVINSPIKADHTVGARPVRKTEPSKMQPPSFNRGPHVRSSIPKYEANLPLKERIGDKPEFNWISTLLPPVAMLAVMLSIYFISGNAMSLMYTVPMYGISMVIAVVNYRSQKKKFQNRQKAVEQDYANQIEVIRKEIADIKDRQMEILNAEFPSPDDCISIVQNRDARMWRVRPDEDMFLALRLGLGKVPAQITLKGDSKEKKSALLVENARYLSAAPITYPFTQYAAVGLVGDKSDATALIKSMIIQAATHHSYDELKLVFFVPEGNAAEWAWIRWLPHVWNEDKTKRYIASDYASAMRISREFEDELGKRAGQKNQGSEKSPYYLFIVVDDTHLRTTELLSTLTSNGKKSYASVLILKEARNQLPAGCTAVIEMQGNSKGRWYPIDNENLFTEFSGDWISDQIYDSFARLMAPVRIFDGAGKKALPTAVSFLEGYGVSTVEGLQIHRRWKEGHPGRSLSVPVGVKSNGETFYFDIHEKKHGAHGMASGRAGSGKSEMVQSWILSLALNFRPDQVAFIIVDFKGDGLLAPFRKLPHLAGSISNLDHNFERNVVALQQEMNRRMALFSQHNVTNITGYTQKYENGETDEAVPFLMVVVDEFAELKQNHPEFMSAIDRVYTIGRSLGIHIVILAQDAAAAASDMIQANSRFRWCMQVATSDASRGMLGTADAYTMSYVPGRGYVKVGNFEVYEEIQSYWSGADYSIDTGSVAAHKEKYAFVSLDGTRTIFADEVTDTSKSSEKEISKVIEYIRKYSEINKIPHAVQIWQPPMPQIICLEDFMRPAFQGSEWKESPTLELAVGLVDDPNRQIQYPLSFAMGKTGHISIQGSPESGKTTFLLSAAVSLAESYTPDTVEIYLFDYDKWALNLVRNLPHIQGSTAAAEPDEVEQIIQKIRDEMNERKTAFLQAGAVSLEGYNAIARKLPAVFLLVDNITAAWDYRQGMDEMLEEVAMKGAGYGIYLIATVPGNLPFRIQNAFRTKMSLYQNEKSEYTNIVGRCEISPENYPGRGLVKLGYPVEFQTALPVFGDNENERNTELHNIVESMKAAWQSIAKAEDSGESIEEIPFIEGEVVLGLDRKMRTPVLLSESGKHCLIVSSTDENRRVGFAQWLISQLENSNAECVLIDDKEGSMQKISDSVSHYFSCMDHMADEYLENLMPVLQARFDEKESNATAAFSPIWLVIMDFGSFFDATKDESITYLKDIVTMGKGINVNLFVLSSRNGVRALGQAGEKLTHAMLRESHALLLGDTFDSHQIFTAELTTRESSRELDDTEGWYLLDGRARRIKLAI